MSAQREIAKTWKTTDAFLMGRKTWEVSMAMGGGGRVKLELFENHLLDGGCVLVKYRVHYL